MPPAGEFAITGYRWRRPDGSEVLIDPAEVDVVWETGFPYDPVRVPAAVAKLYVLAVLDEVQQALVKVRAKYVADLSGEDPCRLLLKAEEYARRAGLDRPAGRKPRASGPRGRTPPPRKTAAGGPTAPQPDVRAAPNPADTAATSGGPAGT
jgi:hypothetical protein